MMNDEVHAEVFRASDIFDPESTYNRMRSRYDPKLKLRGQFYCWEAERAGAPGMEADRWAADSGPPALEAQPWAAESGPPAVVIFADRPAREVPATFDPEFMMIGPTETLMQPRLYFRGDADALPEGTRCRAFLLSRQVIERLTEARPSTPARWMPATLRDIFDGKGKLDGREIAAILASVGDMDGQFLTDEGFEQPYFDFPRFELPAQASRFDALPEGTFVVALIEGDVPGDVA